MALRRPVVIRLQCRVRCVVFQRPTGHTVLFFPLGPPGGRPLPRVADQASGRLPPSAAPPSGRPPELDPTGGFERLSRGPSAVLVVRTQTAGSGSTPARWSPFPIPRPKVLQSPDITTGTDVPVRHGPSPTASSPPLNCKGRHCSQCLPRRARPRCCHTVPALVSGRSQVAGQVLIRGRDGDDGFMATTSGRQRFLIPGPGPRDATIVHGPPTTRLAASHPSPAPPGRGRTPSRPSASRSAFVATKGRSWPARFSFLARALFIAVRRAQPCQSTSRPAAPFQSRGWTRLPAGHGRWREGRFAGGCFLPPFALCPAGLVQRPISSHHRWAVCWNAVNRPDRAGWT